MSVRDFKPLDVEKFASKLEGAAGARMFDRAVELVRRRCDRKT